MVIIMLDYQVCKFSAEVQTASVSKELSILEALPHQPLFASSILAVALAAILNFKFMLGQRQLLVIEKDQYPLVDTMAILNVLTL